jgi:4'-phosphopantetheinyl transferase
MKSPDEPPPNPQFWGDRAILCRLELGELGGCLAGAGLTGAGVTCDLFGVDLAIVDSLRDDLANSLSEDECDRMRRFVQERHRRNFVAARAGLRACLARYVDRGPETLVFECGSHGKPRLRDFPGLEFNLSHSGDRALIGISHGRAIGVDLERVREMPTWLGLARRFFAAAEVEAIVRVPEVEQMPLFFQYWTCKEAYLKGTGDGLGKIRKLAVAIEADRVQVLQKPCHKNFALAPVAVAEGFVGAIAIEV